MPMQTTGPTYNTGFNPYAQMYPTYPQFQPMQTYNQPNQSVNRTVFGRVINSENDITPNEVPMDGSISLFPLADYSKIFAKQWSQDGTIKTTVFSMDPSTDNANQQISFENEVRERLSNLETNLGKLISRQKYHKPYHKNGSSQNKDGDENV